LGIFGVAFVRALAQRGCEPFIGVTGRVTESVVKYPTSDSDFPNFPTPTPYYKGNEIWLLKSMDIVVHSEKSVSTKVSKEIAPFQQEFQI